MKERNFDIQGYMTKGVERVVKDALRATLKDPAESIFMASFAKASKKASDTRLKYKEEGLHVPPFLIASITSNCNLHCAGCYSRQNEATKDCAPVDQMSGEEWGKIFEEARDLGISFILLAGGEPLLRKDVIQSAASYKEIFFPIFTNGVFISDEYFKMFDKNRNLVPIMSIEGHKEATDNRRGEGIYDKLISNMEKFKEKHLIFGNSITVTTENFDDVLSDEFVSMLGGYGCKAAIYVEYVPVSDESKHLALSEEQEIKLRERIDELREKYEEMVFISFPGDEKSSGGCVAAGRGFFHINSHGGAEPCPFSPYSDTNVREASLKGAISSRLFKVLQDTDVLMDDHVGGCVLFEKRDQVEAILQQN
ncbi:radical SAM/SPASM domain-containing protein [Pseudobutyrivibrio xylanivorans]|uniref:Radical SAM superfamily enzyme, MoaA/NifB/PqqE/SkfB family n=1 Tax=Pseudobutyrivibrio xylanivorans TaxID=185007 RepID=A0A1G5RSF0_PSEXY|nr:radical SAM protein [Pseudobutyrivibrio xylanivorans]SCZ76740.1 Radical SAM superfamily enzyme, MoaA/NifB/PqqE/SkfB family [Pseudobutyrivibrio xylanivorans]